jgi:hypothetical protein
MNALSPNKKDISDISLAINSFAGAWGSVDPTGVYTPTLSGKQLWLMMRVEVDEFRDTVLNQSPPKYAALFPQNSQEEKGVIHAQASKIRSGLFQSVWILKVTFMVDDMNYPVGFLAERSQSEVWMSLRRLLDQNHPEERFYLTAETAIGMLR